MRCRWSLVSVFFCLCVVLVSSAGCWRVENGAVVAEIDEPDYRRAKEMLKQGRNPEALAAFERVLAKRGLNNSLETHMDMAILYQQHLRDPISAIYHYQKYLALAGTTAPRRGVVLQQIEAAKREYLASLPGRPSADAGLGDQAAAEKINRLNAQIEQLRSALALAQSAVGLVSGGPAQRGGQQGRVVAAENPVVVSAPDYQVATQAGPVSQGVQSQGAGGGNVVASSQQVQQPQSAATVRAQQPQQQQAQPQQQAPAVRRHTVRQGDSLYDISRQYYGSATNAQVEAIVNANRDVLESRNTSLRAGMVLRIP